MTGDLINQIVRAVVLLGLLVYFVISLGRGLVEDERRLGFGPLRTGTGEDPGIRVLLENRQPPEPARTWENRITVTVLEPVDVVTPNIPDDAAYRLTLHAGAQLSIQPDTNRGLVLSAKEWGKDYTWPVSAVRIQPTATEPQAPPATPGVAAPVPPSRRDPTLFEAADREAVFALLGSRYRGSLEVWWHSAKDLEAINCLPMEAYIEGVVAVEMSPSYPLAALEAQAIASRSYAFAHAILARRAGQEFDLCDTGDDQEYRGAGNGNEAVRTAIYETRGLVMMADRTDPFAPLFCASSGGYTESIDSVLPGARDVFDRVPLAVVMQAQPDRFCEPAAQSLGYLGSHWEYTSTIKPAELRLKLQRLLQPEGTEVGLIHNIRVGRRDPRSNRVEEVWIYHTAAKDPIKMSGHNFRMLVGPNQVRSTLWSPDSPRRKDSIDGKRSVVYEITSTGFGHGVGMSQISAVEMANEGASASQILQQFYHDVELVTKW